jgi:hypothetical protein
MGMGNFAERTAQAPKEAKPAKLSEAMKKVLDKMLSADWYYMHNGKACEYFANETGFRPIGFEGSAIVEGGLIYARMDSKTLEALKKRGVVEVIRDGKECFDAVKVVGMELPERITRALMVKVVRRHTDGIYKPQEFIGYATSEAAVQYLIDQFGTVKGMVVEATVLGEVALTVCNFFKAGA